MYYFSVWNWKWSSLRNQKISSLIFLSDIHGWLWEYHSKLPCQSQPKLKKKKENQTKTKHLAKEENDSPIKPESFYKVSEEI